MVDSENKMDPNEFIYHVDGSGLPQYSWEALCRKLNIDDANDMRYSVKLYISRKTAPNLKYPSRLQVIDGYSPVDWPTPVPVDANILADKSDMNIQYRAGEFINPPPSTIIMDYDSGRLFRVVKREEDDVITLDRAWDKDISDQDVKIWLLPSPVDSTDNPTSKNPDIEVFQRIINFRKN